MKIIDFIELCNESINIKIIGRYGSIISEYDGKNSIDINLNNKKIGLISCHDNTIYLYI